MSKKTNITFLYLFLLIIFIFISIISTSYILNINIYITFMILYILSTLICLIVPKIFGYMFDKEALIRLKKRLNDDKWHEITYINPNDYTDKILSKEFRIAIKDISKLSFKALLEKDNSIIIITIIDNNSRVWITKSYFLFEQLFEIN